MKKQKSISKRIILSYIITAAIIVGLVTFVLVTSTMTISSLSQIESYVALYDYPLEASMTFSDARVKNRIMMTSIFYDDSIYNDGMSQMDRIISIFSGFKSNAGKFNLTVLISYIDNAVAELNNYKSLMKDNDANNRAKRQMQTGWSVTGAECVSLLNEINVYINEQMALLNISSQSVYTNAYNNKTAVENIQNILTAIRLNAREMMYMDEVKNYQTILDDINKILDMLSEYERIAYSPVTPMISALKTGLAEYSGFTVQFYNLIQTTLTNTKAFEGTTVRLNEQLNLITAETTSVVQERVESARIQQNFVMIILVISSILLFAFIVTYAFLLIRAVSGSLKSMAESLKESVGNIDGAARQLSDAATSLAESGSEQAASIEETSATMNETASMAQQNNENTRKAAKLATDTMNSAQKGVSDMKNLIEFMNKLSKSSNEISKIVGDINSIAFQTNILALNASVEAVRAGDAGRSFAVVAEEVRSLSLKSTESANNTSTIINDNINLSSQSVENCSEVGETLKNIFADIEKVNVLIDEISGASEEQAHGVQQVNAALAQMEKATQSNAAISQQSASAANELKNQAEMLSHIYADIDKLVYGSKG